MPPRRLQGPILLVATAQLLSSASGAEFTKSDNTDALNLDSSWEGSGVPGGGDSAFFDSTYGTTGVLSTGSALTWDGIRLTNPGGKVIIDSGSNAIGVGTLGIDMSSATQDLSIERFQLDGSQTWNIASGLEFTIGRSTAARTGVFVNNSAGATITKTGTGTVNLDTGNSSLGDVNWEIQSGLVRAIWNNASAWGTGTITLGGGGIATGTPFGGSVGNWSWNNDIALTDATSSFIDNQNISGTGRGLTLSGVISGSGNLEFRNTANDPGFIYTLTGANTYTGDTSIISGGLQVGSGNLGSGDINIASGASLILAPEEDMTISSVISGAGDIIKRSGDRITITGDNSGGALNWVFDSAISNNDDLGFLNADSIGATGSTITVEDGATGSAFFSTGGHTTDVALSIGSGGSFTWNGSTGTTAALTGGISGAGDFTKVSGQTLFIQSDMALSGDFNINTGVVVMNNNNTASGTIFVNNGTRLEMENNQVATQFTGGNDGMTADIQINSGGEALVYRNGAAALGTGNIIMNGGALNQQQGNWTWTNNIALNDATSSSIGNKSTGSGRWMKLQGIISGSGDLTLNDPAGTITNGNQGIILTGENTMTGTLTIDTFVRVGGVTGNDIDLSAGGGGSLGTADVVINDSSGRGRLSFSRNNNHTVANTLSGDGQLHVGSTGISGSDNQILTLTGTNTYTGGTFVNTGTLLVDGDQSGATGAVSVASGATLGGSGTIGGATTNSGTLAPGNSPGILTFNDGLTLTGTSIFEWELFSNTDTVASRGNATSGYDAVDVTGNVAYDGVFRVQLGGTASDFFNSFWASTHTWTDVFTASGSSSGNFTSFELWNNGAGSPVTNLATYGSFSFDTVNGSLTWTAVPEPGSALVGLLISAGLFHRRRGWSDHANGATHLS